MPKRAEPESAQNEGEGVECGRGEKVIAFPLLGNRLRNPATSAPDSKRERREGRRRDRGERRLPHLVKGNMLDFTRR